MTISNMAFTPATGFRDTTAYPTNPGSEAAAREQIQDGLDQIRDYINNTLIPSLVALNIPITAITGVTATEIQTALEQLKTQIDDATTGTLPDRSIQAIKIALNALTEFEMANDMKKDIIGGITAYNTFTTQVENINNKIVGSIIYAYKNLGGGL